MAHARQAQQSDDVILLEKVRLLSDPNFSNIMIDKSNGGTISCSQFCKPFYERSLQL
jgi:hypothetical protein